MGEETFEERNNGLKKNRGDYGIRVARPGYDAGSCADSQLLFNSNWPIIQIAKVIDFGSGSVELIIYSRIDSSGNTIATYTKPSGMGTVTFTNIDPEYRVGLKYCYKAVGIGSATDGSGTNWFVCKYNVKQHQLGYIPMWYLSDWISDVNGKIILTNIDLCTDIEYPYTDNPTILISPPKDYGIKSSSVFRGVGGLDTGMFSKLVQRVMTTEKSGRIGRIDGEIVSKEILWYASNLKESTPKDEATKIINQYEVYGYTTGLGRNMECVTEEKSYIHHPIQAIFNDYGSDNRYVVGATTVGQSADVHEKAMVIVRSPMVSPEYEEVIV